MSRYIENCAQYAWDHKTPLWSRTLDKYFWTVNEIYDYFNDDWIIDPQVKEDFDSVCDSYPQLCNYLELYICTPVYFPELEIPEFLYDELPESYDDIYDVIPQDHPIFQKIDKLNQYITKQKYIIWYEQSCYKPIPESLSIDYKPKPLQPRRKRLPFDD